MKSENTGQSREYEVTLRHGEEPEFTVTVMTWSEDLAIEEAQTKAYRLLGVDSIDVLLGEVAELELRGVQSKEEM